MTDKDYSDKMQPRNRVKPKIPKFVRIGVEFVAGTHTWYPGSVINTEKYTDVIDVLEKHPEYMV
uniref:Uncharacterized protein n=1 Tax=viral metagenome TaxID=1070528 RepID=A0A6M3KA57_9ZZZZ